MDPNIFTPQLRARLFEVMTGRQGDVTGQGSVADKLAAAFGPGRRGGRVNVAAAAKALGVTPRTVQRWVSGEIRNPKPGTTKEINRRARQAATTKRGRQRAMAARRGDRAARRGAQLRVAGTMGPRDYERRGRVVNQALSPEMVDALRQAYEESGDQGLLEFTQQLLDREYVEDWNITDINDFRID